MELIGFIVVVGWALPMIFSMGKDSDHVSTLAGVMFSNGAVFGTFWALSKLGLPQSKWWLVLLIPGVVFIYYGIWYGCSTAFNQFVREALSIKKNR